MDANCEPKSVSSGEPQGPSAETYGAPRTRVATATGGSAALALPCMGMVVANGGTVASMGEMLVAPLESVEATEEPPSRKPSDTAWLVIASSVPPRGRAGTRGWVLECCNAFRARSSTASVRVAGLPPMPLGLGRPSEAEVLRPSSAPCGGLGSLPPPPAPLLPRCSDSAGGVATTSCC